MERKVGKLGKGIKCYSCYVSLPLVERGVVSWWYSDLPITEKFPLERLAAVLPAARSNLKHQTLYTMPPVISTIAEQVHHSAPQLGGSSRHGSAIGRLIFFGLTIALFGMGARASQWGGMSQLEVRSTDCIRGCRDECVVLDVTIGKRELFAVIPTLRSTCVLPVFFCPILLGVIAPLHRCTLFLSSSWSCSSSTVFTFLSIL